MKSRIFLSSPHMGGSEQKYIQEAFDSNWIAPLGPNVSGFEDSIERYLGEGSYAAALSSGTSAIHLALIMLGVVAGDEVICQSMTFSASANPIMYQGAHPIFVDSEKDTWNICPVHLETAIQDRIAKGKKPKAIVAVHLYGMPFEVDSVIAVARKYDIPVVEDSAEALGSSYKGKPCGTFGDISILSFNGNKIITSSGGGALVTKDSKIKERAIYLATQARDSAPHYQHSVVGFNYRLSNICAGIGRGQMEVLDDHVALRRKNHEFYAHEFGGIEGVKVFAETSEDFYSNHWLSCVVFSDGAKMNSDTFRMALEEENIESRPLWKPMHLQPVFENSPYYGNSISEDLFKNGICLPSGSNLTEDERQRIAAVIARLR